MMNIEVTKREVLVSVIIILLMISVGFFLATSLHNSISVDNEKYFRALKIDNNPSLFNHAINTDVGNMVSYGTFKANEPVTDSMIDGEYFSIVKIEEHYVQKTRTVNYVDSNGTPQTRIETYWEWDEVGREYFNTETFTFLEKVFDYEKIKFKNYSYNSTVKPHSFSNVRYIFRTIPLEFDAVIYSKAKSKTITNTKIHYNTTIESLINKKENEANETVIVFWVIWSLLIIVAVVGFVVLDNRYLNNN